MKKRLLLATGLVILALVGCSSNENANASKPDNKPIAIIDKDVEITISDGIHGFETQEDCDKAAKENNYASITLNEDGTVTYKMKESQHKEMISTLKDTINQSCNDMIGSEEYPSFVKIEASDDFTSFTIKTNTDDLSISENISALSFAMYGMMYNEFNGTKADNIHVEYVYEETGEVVHTFDTNK